MTGWRLYCADCERRTAHTEYGTRGVLATCNACETLRSLPATTDDDCSENDDQTRLDEVEA